MSELNSHSVYWRLHEFLSKRNISALCAHIKKKSNYLYTFLGLEESVNVEECRVARSMVFTKEVFECYYMIQDLWKESYDEDIEGLGGTFLDGVELTFPESGDLWNRVCSEYELVKARYKRTGKLMP